MITLYELLKSLHIVAVICWMAALLYLPRLYVYHADVPKASARSALFKVMERRLLRAIMTPAMGATWVLGLGLATLGNHFISPWFHLKLLLLLVLSALHAAFARWQKDFAEDRNQRTARFYRIANEIPAVLMVAIVLLAVLKPF